MLRFEEAHEGWNTQRLTQAQAARLLGVGERTFRCRICRHEIEGLDGLTGEGVASTPDGR
ncbi:MAG: helix-turn-helix domain-containing protein [Betaproteobacteria bacterium]|jgi:hypothetical protein